MRVSLLVTLAFLSPATSLPAQSEKAASGSNPAVSTTRMLWEQPTKYITTVAEELPESTYAYRPTPEVRSLGQLIGHVAGAQYMFCAAAMGEPDEAIGRRRCCSSVVIRRSKSSRRCEPSGPR